MSADFYSRLSPFSDFNSLHEDRHYSVLPSEWFVVICDIRGSTKAIEEGRYQEVNTLGAASIATVQLAWPGAEIPFVFGGDGASFLIPPGQIEDVKLALGKLKNFARVNYRMELRVGTIAVSEVAAQNLKIEVAKFSIAPKKAIALMRGGGLAWAENQIKKFPERYCLADGNENLDDLKGLSCRWHPMNSRKGAVVSLLVKPMENDAKIFAEILNKFESILGADDKNPINIRAMKYKNFWQILKTERKYVLKFFSKAFFERLLYIALSVMGFKWRLPVPFDARGYETQIPGHSDYRKFDDMLRMILDCSFQQIAEMRAYLEQLHARKLICYGMHESSHALMTCLVENLGEGGHIHFIDGGDGGYAVAAKQMKDQIAKS